MKKLLILFLALILLAACAQTQSIAQQKEVPAQPEKTQPQPIVQASAPAVSIVSVPEAAHIGEEFQITWKVDGPLIKIPSTSIQFDTKSHSGALGIDQNPTQVGYSGHTNEYSVGSFDIPNTFTAKITPIAGATSLYYRAHALINGENYWTPEQLLTVAKPQIGVKSFTVIADDSGFTPSSGTAHKGDEITIKFTVSTTNVYHAGLDFRSDLFNSPSVKPGYSWTTPTFNIQSTFKVGSYWPTTSMHKADFVINVE